MLNDEINEVVINNRFSSKFSRIAVGQFFLLCGGGSDIILRLTTLGGTQTVVVVFCFVSSHTSLLGSFAQCRFVPLSSEMP